MGATTERRSLLYSACYIPGLNMKTLAVFLFVLRLGLTSPLSRRYFDSPVQNDLVNGTPCRAITIIFARGTFEEGNVGSVAGPPFFQAVADIVGTGNVAVQGVNLSNPKT